MVVDQKRGTERVLLVQLSSLPRLFRLLSLPVSRFHSTPTPFVIAVPEQARLSGSPTQARLRSAVACASPPYFRPGTTCRRGGLKPSVDQWRGLNFARQRRTSQPHLSRRRSFPSTIPIASNNHLVPRLLFSAPSFPAWKKQRSPSKSVHYCVADGDATQHNATQPQISQLVPHPAVRSRTLP